MSFWRPCLMETKSLFDLLGSLKFVLLKEYRSALIGQNAFFGKSGPVKGPGLELSRVTRQRQAYPVSGFVMKPGRNLRVALCLSCPNTTSAEKAQTSLLRLAAANVRRKAVLRVRTASEQTFIGWGGCLMRKRRTRAKTHPGVPLKVLGGSIEKDLIRALRSGSWDISNPLEALRLDRADR